MAPAGKLSAWRLPLRLKCKSGTSVAYMAGAIGDRGDYMGLGCIYSAWLLPILTTILSAWLPPLRLKSNQPSIRCISAPSALRRVSILL
jgi:hypothetical protein